MLVRALLQTSLVLWLAQQTLQGGVKPQSVSWGRVLPARGVNVGVKPGVAGALGALGNRYGSKAMKTGLGRYPGAQLGVGGYRSLGLGGRAGLKPGGYGTQGAYGASLGTGMGLGTGLPNGLGLGYGQDARRAYGAGLGNLPGYGQGSLAGMGYHGARPGLGLGYPTGQRAEDQIPGLSAADLGGPELPSLGQDAQDPKRKKSRALVPMYGNRDRSVVPEMPVGVDGILGPFAAKLQKGGEVKGLDPIVRSSSIGKNQGLYASQAQGGGSHEPTVLKRKSTTNHEATLGAGGVRQQLPLKNVGIRSSSSASSPDQRAREYDRAFQQNQWTQNCGSTREIDHRELSLVPQLQLGTNSEHLGHAAPKAQKEKFYPSPFSQTQEPRDHLTYAADKQGVRDLVLVTEGTDGLKIHGRVAIESGSRGSLSLQGRVGLIVPPAGGSQGVAVDSVEGQESEDFVGEAKHLYRVEHGGKEPKALGIPRQTRRNNQATRYTGGAGNYLGASLGAGGYGAGLGQGTYLGGAAGKLGAAAALGQGGYPQGAAGKLNGYGEGAYLGAVGNGYGGGDAAKALAAGYGNGFSDGYGAGLGYPAELADVAENKAGKRKALSTGGYGGQGGYGALGAGLDSTAGKYGGAPQVPYGNAPVIPTRLEGEGGYPYAAQPLSLTAEGAKTSSKYAGAGFGNQQTGYGAQMGATQDALGEQAGKYGGMNGPLGNGYKG